MSKLWMTRLASIIGIALAGGRKKVASALATLQWSKPPATSYRPVFAAAKAVVKSTDTLK